jgi:hypothetical protein
MTTAKPVKKETEGVAPNQDLLPTNFAKETKLCGNKT